MHRDDSVGGAQVELQIIDEAQQGTVALGARVGFRPLDDLDPLEFGDRLHCGRPGHRP